MKRPDEASATREYIQELEAKLRDSEAAREALMAQTASHLGALERQTADFLRNSSVPGQRSAFMLAVDRVLSPQQTQQDFAKDLAAAAASGPTTAYFCLSVAEKFINLLKMAVRS